VPSGHGIDSQPLCKATLVESWFIMDGGKHGELERGEVLGLSYLCEHTETYLMKTSRKMRGDAMNGGDCCPLRAGFRNATTGRLSLGDT